MKRIQNKHTVIYQSGALKQGYRDGKTDGRFIQAPNRMCQFLPLLTGRYLRVNYWKRNNYRHWFWCSGVLKCNFSNEMKSKQILNIFNVVFVKLFFYLGFMVFNFISRIHSKPINIRWIRTGSHPFEKMMSSIV